MDWSQYDGPARAQLDAEQAHRQASVERQAEMARQLEANRVEFARAKADFLRLMSNAGFPGATVMEVRSYKRDWRGRQPYHPKKIRKSRTWPTHSVYNEADWSGATTVLIDETGAVGSRSKNGEPYWMVLDDRYVDLTNNNAIKPEFLARLLVKHGLL